MAPSDQNDTQALAALAARAERNIQSAKASLKKFADDLLANPQHTLTWAGSVFGATAELSVWKTILEAAQNSAAIVDIRTNLQELIFHGAVRNAHRSVCSDLLDQEILKAQTKAYLELKLYLPPEPVARA